jgi:hypothetical protein
MKMILFKRKFNLFLIILPFCTTSYLLISCSDSSEDNKKVIEREEEVDIPTTCNLGSLFIEKEGIVRVDIENPSAINNGWTTSTTLSGFVGSGYLIWTGNDNFNAPGIGIMKFSVKINNPGTYQFVWSSRIATGTSNTEHNDSWLRIQGDDFYGEKAGTGERVYPKGSGKTPNPEGTSSEGWLKVYMNRTGEWFWRSSTNDKDPFNIFATFDKTGTYDVEISGRSKSHAIDQFVLFRADQTLLKAQTATFSEITCK